eukprot:TRINITY_DN20202_c0_g1_i1.p1 TRINITY_DN20202_c0_g1~~TRINITY_DN20202_c0_g1_i1.p1  ORF type:complete len:392 (+),score=55.13 TRINITY_DN20202_c0_g1_i1:85-1176(+)
MGRLPDADEPLRQPGWGGLAEGEWWLLLRGTRPSSTTPLKPLQHRRGTVAETYDLGQHGLPFAPPLERALRPDGEAAEVGAELRSALRLHTPPLVCAVSSHIAAPAAAWASAAARRRAARRAAADDRRRRLGIAGTGTPSPPGSPPSWAATADWSLLMSPSEQSPAFSRPQSPELLPAWPPAGGLLPTAAAGRPQHRKRRRRLPRPIPRRPPRGALPEPLPAAQLPPAPSGRGPRRAPVPAPLREVLCSRRLSAAPRPVSPSRSQHSPAAKGTADAAAAAARAAPADQQPLAQAPAAPAEGALRTRPTRSAPPRGHAAAGTAPPTAPSPPPPAPGPAPGVTPDLRPLNSSLSRWRGSSSGEAC